MTLVSSVPSLQTEASDMTMSAESIAVNMDTVIHDDDIPNKTVSSNGKALQDLFEQSLAETDEYGTYKFKWVGDNEIQVDGLSGMTLHNFLLKAEALGKKVSYRRSIVLQIED